MIKALLLFSDGLDSLLAGLLLKNQGIKVFPVRFITPFFGWKYKENPEMFYQKTLDVGFEKGLVVDITEEYLEVLKKPKYGYGDFANPCLDCKILMIKLAKNLLGELGCDFIATGEVVGQRPMSQNKQALGLIEKVAGVEGFLLRPLSAKLLAPTIPEAKGLIDREKLLDLQGRQRKTQFELAKKWGLKEIPTPAGGCLLTDPQIGTRVLRVLKEKRPLNYKTAQILCLGRHFFEENLWVVLGRNQEENQRIQKIINVDYALYTLNESAPIACILEGNPPLEFIKELLLKYSPKAKRKLAAGERIECIKL
ncbi:tRNA 4-thiouridine(8) synthase ThiI [Thermodesulfobacterium sp. TA1]|uniref:tRNA 4-thiouridine(8) synthase ThiI n=1 Tax=Thermodesulfobacterium sp. TA1 TaxID=2234087 RepID=UPI0012318C87|nr:tRNA 4-thiouridine(8) synthase ThiI [Thermodesulfobacterium sp. TA1]QER41889.1 tRNA 4-thiouridine(8) synthase ThiI [Thermodesulfobacterium sp. TA1]